MSKSYDRGLRCGSLILRFYSRLQSKFGRERACGFVCHGNQVQGGRVSMPLTAEYEVDLASDPAHDACRFTLETIEGWHAAQLAPTVVMLVDYIVRSAEHVGRGPLHLRLTYGRASLRMSCCGQFAPDVVAEQCRGMLDRATTAWDAESAPIAQVWFELALPPGVPGSYA